MSGSEGAREVDEAAYRKLAGRQDQNAQAVVC